MPTPTYTPLANITLGSSAASVTFSSISQAYRDLVLVVSAKADASGKNLYLRYNSDLGSYLWVNMSGDGSAAASSATDWDRLEIGTTVTIDATNISTFVINVMDYSATDKHKSSISRGNNAGAGVNAVAGRWANTAAISTVNVFISSGNFVAGSTLALYGIAA